MAQNHPDISLLGRLQEFDRERVLIEGEIAALGPKVQEMEKQITALLRKLEAGEAALAANERERRKLEGEVQLHQAKVVKLKKQQAEVTIPSQYQVMEKELQWCAAEIAKAEERELELMLEADTVGQQNGELRETVAQQKAQLTTFVQAARKQRDDGQARLAALATSHAELAGQLTAPNRSLYERLRRKYPKGPICVEAEGGVCSGCKMTMRLAVWQELRASRPFLTCESCSRVLYYLAEEEVLEG